MAADCPYCEGRKRYKLANSNVETNCEYCNARGEIPRPENFDITKIQPGLITRIANFFGNGNNDA